MWDLIVSVPDHCLSFYFEPDIPACTLPFFQHFKTCSQEGSPGLYLHPGSTQALILLCISAMT